MHPAQIEFTDAALRRVIGEYTREAGVRTLERQIGAIARKVAARVASEASHTARVDARSGARLSRPADASGPRRRSAPRGRAWRRGWPGPKRAATCSTSRPRSCPAGRVR